MASDTFNNETVTPIIDFGPTFGLTDYFCPFCNEKLFRGKVTRFSMVCSGCNKLVKSEDIAKKDAADPE